MAMRDDLPMDQVVKQINAVMIPKGYRLIGTCATCRWMTVSDHGGRNCSNGVTIIGDDPHLDFGCTLWQARDDDA
jgi:hypothetical protein